MQYNNHRIRRVELNTGTLSTVAAGAEAGSDIGMNNEPLGLCNHPRAIAFDQSTPILDSVAYVCAYDSLLRLNLLTNSMEVMRTGSFEYRPRDVCCFAPNKLLVLSQYGLSVTDTRRRHVYASASDSTGGGDDKLPAIATPAKAVTAAGAAAAAATVVVPYDDVFIVPFQNGVETNGAVADAKFGYMSGLVLLRDDGTVRCGDVDRCYIMDQDHNTVRTITGSICAFELPPSNGMLP